MRLAYPVGFFIKQIKASHKHKPHAFWSGTNVMPTKEWCCLDLEAIIPENLTA